MSALRTIRGLLTDASLAGQAFDRGLSTYSYEHMAKRVGDLRNAADDIADTAQPAVTHLLHGRGAVVGVTSLGLLEVQFERVAAIKKLCIDDVEVAP